MKFYKIKTFSVLLAIFSLFLMPAKVVWGEGGELGNPGMSQEIINQDVGYSIRLPENWTAMESGAILTLFNPQLIDSSNLIVSYDVNAQYSSVQDLLGEMRERNPKLTWALKKLGEETVVVGKLNEMQHFLFLTHDRKLIDVMVRESLMADKVEREIIKNIIGTIQLF